MAIGLNLLGAAFGDFFGVLKFQGFVSSFLFLTRLSGIQWEVPKPSITRISLIPYLIRVPAAWPDLSFSCLSKYSMVKFCFLKHIFTFRAGIGLIVSFAGIRMRVRINQIRLVTFPSAIRAFYVVHDFSPLN
jgi:hypothetical protein